jgi:hypothetical protein
MSRDRAKTLKEDVRSIEEAENDYSITDRIPYKRDEGQRRGRLARESLQRIKDEIEKRRNSVASAV